MSITSETRANALLAVPRKLLDNYLMQAADQMARERMVVGEKIKKAREAKRWKQKDLAVRVHVEPQTISNWERGVRVPDWDKLEILARELEQPLSYFVTEEQLEATSDDRLRQIVREELEGVLQILGRIEERAGGGGRAGSDEEQTG